MAACCLSTASTARADTIYDLAADFSIANNPAGQWSYGYTSTFGGEPTLYPTTSGPQAGLEAWDRGQSFPNNYPRVVRNNSALPLFWGTNVALLPGQVGSHPGPQGEFSVIRFLVPTTGTYHYSIQFFGQDNLTSTSTDILFPGSPSISQDINGTGVGTLRTGDVSLTAGQVIDLIVGSRGGNTGDTVAINATFTLVPSPAAAGLLALAGLTASRRRRA